MTTFGNSEKLKFGCQILIMAHGMWQPNVPGDDWVKGLDLTVGYEKLDEKLPDVEELLGKSVLILGAGNAAFETAEEIRPFASDIVIASRRKARFLHETSYVGDIRGSRSHSRDSHELKSLDGVVTTGTKLAWALVECDQSR
jgi:cation diffusion facilitator CzcD-associated flavoprotein CzcO